MSNCLDWQTLGTAHDNIQSELLIRSLVVRIPGLQQHLCCGHLSKLQSIASLQKSTRMQQPFNRGPMALSQCTVKFSLKSFDCMDVQALAGTQLAGNGPKCARPARSKPDKPHRAHRPCRPAGKLWPSPQIPLQNSKKLNYSMNK